jgi:hypothetical protein
MPSPHEQDIIKRLEKEGVLNSTTLSEEQKNLIRGLTTDEVKYLISVRQKVGDYSEAAHPAGRPWIL